MKVSNFWRNHGLIARAVVLALATLTFVIPISSLAATSYIEASAEKSSSGSSFTINVKANKNLKFYLEYGLTRASKTSKSEIQTLKSGQTTRVLLANLKPSTKYYYQVRYQLAGSTKYIVKSGGTFTTGEPSNVSVFAIQADPHMDENSSADVYKSTLNQIKLAQPEFLIDLGDIFMTDKLPKKDEASIRQRFQMMKDFYQIINPIPLKLVLGNHDGELGYSTFNTKQYRKEYFPEQTGDLAYYSFTGPNQLHVVLDIFTYTTSSPKSDGWQWTLGKTQYDWLKRTLETSDAKFKFVYVHHLLVGDAQSRGGVEIAGLNEWGGKNLDGTYGFDQFRLGWGKPVHQLLVDNGVSFVFKGHDHLYVKQELDGIIYQTLPQPSHPVGKANPSQYGYLSGKAVSGSGFLKVTIDGDVAKVEFVKSDGSIADSYLKAAA